MINFSPLHIYMFEPFPTGRSISSTSQMFAIFYLRPWPYPYIKWSVGCNRQSIHFSIHCRLVLWNKYVSSNGGVKDSQPPLVPARANWYPPQWRRMSEVGANGGHFWVSPQPERAGQQDTVFFNHEMHSTTHGDLKKTRPLNSLILRCLNLKLGFSTDSQPFKN